MTEKYTCDYCQTPFWITSELEELIWDKFYGYFCSKKCKDKYCIHYIISQQIDYDHPNLNKVVDDVYNFLNNRIL